MRDAGAARSVGPYFSLTRLFSPKFFAEVAFALLSGILCLAISGYFSVHTGLPGSLHGDHLVALVQAKSYINGHGFRLDSQLGYPLVLDRMYFPNFDKSYQAFMWLAARVTHNPFLIVHAMYMAGLLLMTVFGYWILRRIGVRAWLAGIGSIAAVLTPFMMMRSYNHDFLALAISAPLGFGLALRLGSGDPEDDLRSLFRDPLTLISVVVVAFSGLYYAFYTVMLALFAAVAVSLGQRRWAPLLAWAVVSVGIVVLLLFNGYGLHLPDVLAGRYPQIERKPAEQILYGLDFPAAADAFDFVPKIAQGLAHAKTALPDAFDREGGHEWPGAALSLAILAAPLVAAAALAQERPLSRKARTLATAAVCLCFALLFGVRGGIGFLFNLAVSPQIRADSRLMPFLDFGGVIVLCLVAEMMSSSFSRRIFVLAPLLAAALLAACIAPTAGIHARLQRAHLGEPLTQQLITSLPAMLQAKDRNELQTVLELPVAPWPTAPPIRDFDVYQHYLPYIYDRPHDATRWSYGIDENQEGFGALQFLNAEPQSLVDRARHYGFDSVLVQKRAYDADELARLKGALAAQLGPACRVYEDSLMILYALKCAGPPGLLVAPGNAPV